MIETLETERLILRKLKLEDAVDIFVYASDPEVTRYMTWDTHQSIEDTKAYLKHMSDIYEGGNISWALWNKADSRV